MRKLLIVLVAAAFVVGFTVPAIAADWGFYGSSRMTTFMFSDSKELTGTGYDDDDLTWALQPNSRIGAKVKAGDVGGHFEYGTGINLRILYGTWNFGAGSLLVGQTYTPVNLFYSAQVCPYLGAGDDNMLPYGGVYDGRRAMLQLSMAGLKVALIQPSTANIIAANTDTDTTIPKIEASYSIKLGPAALSLVGGYNSYDETNTATDKDESVDSYIIGLGFNVGLGAAYVKGDVYTGQNLGPYGLWQAGADDPTWDGTAVKDCDTMGYLLVAGFKVSDMFSLEAGYGHNEHELDVTGSKDDETNAYYVQATINLAKGVSIVPEIGKIDFKKNAADADEGDTTYYGAKWQINF
jgi:hypothetical protein